MNSFNINAIANKLIDGVRFLTLFIVLATWTVIGFFFWIPLLTRATAMFSFGILYTMLTPEPQEYAERLRAPLDTAMVFYVEGFQRIFATLYPPTLRASGVREQIKFEWQKFLFELFWTVIFWTVIIFSPSIFSYTIKIIKKLTNGA